MNVMHVYFVIVGMPKKYIYKNRGKTLSYDQSQLQQAVECVQSSNLSIRKASQHFGIPKSTIADRISGKYSVSVTHGRPPALAPEIENKIVSSVKMASKLGIGLSRKQVLQRVNTLCKRMDIETTYSNFHAGKDWWEGVKKRHPELVIRKPEKLSTVRARMLNLEVINKYFDELENVIHALNLAQQPSHIWNADETGFNFEHSPVSVVAEKGERSVTSKTSNRSTNLTAMACVNANGDRMPPMLIVKGKTHRCLHTFNTAEAPEGTVWTYQKSGWITDSIGEQWFDQVFLPNCGPDRPQLLILDGHASHETLAIIERAIEEGITLLTLPPHCTHYLQPLDRSVFGPLKRAYNEACSTFMQDHPLHLVNKHTFPTLFKEAWLSAVNPSNVANGFRACGIMPLNRNAIPSIAYGPSKPTDVSIGVSATCTSGGDMSYVPVSSQEVYPGSWSPILHGNDPLLTSGNASGDAFYTLIVPQPALPSIEALLCSDDANSVPALDVSPVLDISDSTHLLALVESGDIVMEELSVTNCCLDNVTPKTTTAPTLSATMQCIDELFATKVVSSRPVTAKKRNTGHKLLTSEEILQDKRQLEDRETDEI